MEPNSWNEPFEDEDEDEEDDVGSDDRVLHTVV